MLKITVLQIGKDKDKWITVACEHYLKLLKRFAKIESQVVAEVKHAASLPPEELKRAQGEAIITKLDKGTIIALTDSGEKFDSGSFARFLERLQTSSGGQATFIIGGAYGLSEEVIDRSDYAISLSPLTFSHQLVRPILLEQLYRGFSILAGTDYHK